MSYPPKVAVFTLGCKLNFTESEYIAEKFNKSGYTIVDFDKSADLYILNICAVTHVAEKKSRQLINKTKKRGHVIITGCTTNKEITESKEYIKDKNKIIDKAKLLLGNQKIIPNNENNLGFKKNRTRAFIKIQTGCNCFCSYCIIPYLRGTPQSIKATEILENINNKCKQGYKEIVLTGININLYKDNNIDLTKLIQLILEKTKIPRIRLGSIHPAKIDDNFISLFNNSRLCNQVHLSLQNGSDKILRAMNRPYTRNTFLNLVKSFTKLINGLQLQLILSLVIQVKLKLILKNQ